MGGGNIGLDGELNEADITEDVPTESRQLSSWVRRTRQNKIRKIVREVYLRDDITPETFDGADMVLILDTNMALHQLDFIAEDECINHVVVPYTVLQEVRHRHMGTYARLRALCRLEVENATEESSTKIQRDTVSKRGHTTKDMSHVRNARRFYVFPNEFFRETYVERLHEETQNDRNDRAIRRVAHWYRRHIVGPEVLLLTDDRGCKEKALADGLSALTAREFVEKMKKLFPDAGEKLAFREEEDLTVGAATSSSPIKGKKTKEHSHFHSKRWRGISSPFEGKCGGKTIEGEVIGSGCLADAYEHLHPCKCTLR
jgi:exosome complex exonuclease DIS3/RRP44